jgi:predicted kinase
MKTLYFLIGAPGVGKSTFLKEASQEIYGNDKLLRSVVAPDNVRSIVECPEAKPDGGFGISQKNEKFVWTFVNDVLSKKADKGELIIVDATHSRSKAISNYKKYSDRGYRIVGIDFSKDIDIDTILTRNANREDYKFVPEDIVRSMHERCQTLEIPTWVEVIKPSEFVEHYTKVSIDFSHMDSITVVGDIHGCYDEYVYLLDNHGIDLDHTDEKRAVIFVGDYFDRGYNVIGVFKHIRKLRKKYWVLTLMGNHEEPLRFYREYFTQVSEDTQKYIREVLLKDFAQKEQLLKESKSLYEKQLRSYKQPEWFRAIKSWFTLGATDLDIEFNRSKIDLIEKALEKLSDIEPESIDLLRKFQGKSYKQFDKFIEDIQEYPKAFEEIKNFIWQHKPTTDIVRDPEYGFHKLKRTSLGTCKRFILSDVKYTEVMDFVKRCAQMFYVDFHGQKVLVTHGGLAGLPDKSTPTADMVRGVGGYEDALLCAQTFDKNHPDVIQVHGHRNLENLSTHVTENVYNVNGDVDLGLRAVEFRKDRSVEITEIGPKESTKEFYRKAQIAKAKKFKAKKLSADEEGKGLLQMFQDHTHIDVKKLPNDIAAVNFTKKAFEKGVWDELTIKARGLFVDINKELKEGEINVIARGYHKFFNVGEKHGFSTRDIRELAYPLFAYEKANGYLGLLSVDNRDPNNPQWFISSKSTTEGEFAKVFSDLINPELNDSLKSQMIKDNITLVFEVIEPTFDPHIEEYSNPELVLLDAIKNNINFEKLPYDSLADYVKLFNGNNTFATIRKKHILRVCENFNDYWNFLKGKEVPLLSNDGCEGYVFEDSTQPQNMFKVKTDWYSFWKYMRTIKIRIASRIRNTAIRTGEIKLEKSDSIKIKEGLHREEDFKVFTFMVELALKDFPEFEKMSIIDIRNKFMEETNAPLGQ